MVLISRRSFARRSGVLAAVLLAAAPLAACGDGGDDDEGGGEGSGDGLAATTTSSAPPEDLDLGEGQAPLSEIELTLTEVAQADAPTAVVTRPGTDVLYVAERAGAIRPLEASGSGARRSYEVADEAALDVSEDVVTEVEQGLLDIAFSPDGATLYVSYSLAPDGATQIDAYTMDGDTPDPGSRREILSVEQPEANHNGGDIEFGPDGYLYVALGDGGGAGDPEGNGQDTEALLGKILRIDPEGASGEEPYAVPEDNPFVDGGGAPEVWLYGVRNPWRIAFDPATDDLWIADVGQNAWEEIDVLPAADGGGRGANLGWNALEGTHEFEGEAPEGAVPPVFEYSHEEGCSITGGVVYRGRGVPGLDGAYLFGDYCQGDLRALRVADGEVTEEHTFEGVNVGELVSFGVDADGEVYAVSLEGGIYRIDAG